MRMDAGRPPRPARIQRIAVVVPAHNERDVLPACLRSLRHAADAVPVPVDVIVVADDCTDGTSAAALDAASGSGPETLIINFALRNVGAARAAGVAAALERADPAGLWIASTDADTLVSTSWLAGQLAHADRGADLVLGTVTARDWHDWPAALTTEYQRRYDSKLSATGHQHVHGANLGVRAMCYLAAGGFPPLPAHEDVALVEAIRRSGGRIVTALDLPVATSTRRLARAPAGFGAYLQRLATEVRCVPQSSCAPA